MKKEEDLQQQALDDTAENYELLAMYHSGDSELQATAIIRFFAKIENFIWHFIKQQWPTLYGDPYFNEELFTCCKIAFLEQIGQFDPSKGTLSTFMTRPFKHEMYEWVNRELHNTTGYFVKMMQQVQDAKKELAAKGIEPTTAAISNLTGLSVKKVEQALKNIEAKKTLSIDDEESWEENLKDQHKSPEEIFLENEQISAIGEALKSLPSQDRIAIILHFGLDGGAQRSYNAIAKKMGICAPQVQTCIARGLHILRGNEALKSMFGQGAMNYRQQQLDGIEISLITNANVIDAYSVLDEDGFNNPAETKNDEEFLTF